MLGLRSRSVRPIYKGSGWTIIPERRRAEMLLALRVVDYVHIFDEADPILFLSELEPDVHSQRRRPHGQNYVEREAVLKGGGTLFLFDRIPGLSTSDLIREVGTASAANC